MKRFAHKTSLLFSAILLLTLALPVSALADGGSGGNEFTQTVKGYRVTLVFEKSAAVGENQIHVSVRDAMNMPVPQADLEVSVVEGLVEHVEAAPTAEAATMPGMGGISAQPTAEIASMSVMKPAGDHDQMGMVALAAGPESGEYAGEIAIEGDGDQTVRVHLTIAGELMEADFPLHVPKSNTGAIVLGSFFAVNIALVAAAVVMKPKPVAVTLSKKA